MLGFIGHIHQFRHRSLHLKCHLVSGNPGIGLGVLDRQVPVAVEGGDCIDQFFLMAGTHTFWVANIVHRVSRGIKLNTLKFTW